MSSLSEHTNLFFLLSDDVVLNIFEKLEDDPRNWARLLCVCTKFNSLIRNICFKNKCLHAIPSVVSDLANPLSPPGPSWWTSLYNISVSCPGLLHAGVLLHYSHFGLERDLGPDEQYRQPNSSSELASCSSENRMQAEEAAAASCSWSMFDDLYFDTVYNVSESSSSSVMDVDVVVDEGEVEREVSVKRPKRCCGRSVKGHLALGIWSLSREEGNKLLGSRFRGDSLYICAWPGCVHSEEKRDYMLFRGIFKNFKRSRVWRTINDGNGRSRIDIGCAFCECKETWDLHSAFCLTRAYGYCHEDGEPVVRAYVCENGHVSGAWTDLPLYT